MRGTLQPEAGSITYKPRDRWHHELDGQVTWQMSARVAHELADWIAEHANPNDLLQRDARALHEAADLANR